MRKVCACKFIYRCANAKVCVCVPSNLFGAQHFSEPVSSMAKLKLKFFILKTHPPSALARRDKIERQWNEVWILCICVSGIHVLWVRSISISLYISANTIKL